MTKKMFYLSNKCFRTDSVHLQPDAASFNKTKSPKNC